LTGPETLDLARESIIVLLQVSAPAMIVGLTVGLIVSLIQALTQIQEMTLAFIPKILAMFASLLIFFPFMGQTLNTFMERIAQRIIAAGG